MKAGMSVIDSELPRLKQLASELLAAESPELSALDQIASLAAAIASRSREAARQQLLDEVMEGARAIFPAAPDELTSRLAQAAFDELASLGTLLDRAAAAAAAFHQADSGLMAAREKGDYAAMAPLAIEADGQKKALAAASAEFTSRIGLGGTLTAQPLAANAASAPEAVPSADPPQPAAAAEPVVDAAFSTVAEPDAAAMADEPAGELSELDQPAEGPPERRRLRALIRQMRPADAP